VGEAWRLTDAPGGVISFRWSPDGRSIGYVASDPLPQDRQRKLKAKDDARVVGEQVERNRLYVVDASEENDRPRDGRRLTDGPFSIYADWSPGFDWSPNGTAIVFAHVPTPGADEWTRSDISIVDVETAMVRPLVQSPRSESSPFFAPDGRLIAFAASDDPPSWAYDSALYVVAAAGGTPRKLADSFDHRPELLGWTARANNLVFRENRGTTTRLYTMPLDGAPRRSGRRRA
jgi:Tol biopolymer transport system component